MAKKNDIENLYIPEFEKYLRTPEPSVRERADYWRTAIGLQAVDRDLHISLVGNQSAIQSANAALSKSNNCTLEEIATLQIIQRNPRVTQKQIAAEIGKSERTIKTITVNLTQKGIIVRRNGKRDGYWEIIDK